MKKILSSAVQSVCIVASPYAVNYQLHGKTASFLSEGYIKKYFADFKLKKIVPYNHNSSKFIFEFPQDRESLLPIPSHVTIKASDPEALVDSAGYPIIRHYSPLHAPDNTARELVLLVKRYDAGNISKHIFSLKEGDTVSIKGPNHKYPYKINEFEHVAFIGGGTGIAPFYQILTHALLDDSNRTKFTLLYSNVSEDDILLRQELDGLAKSYPDTFSVIYVLDTAPNALWTGPTGYISAEHIKKYIPPPTLNEKLKIFVCGPPPQIVAIAGMKKGPNQGVFGGILKNLGYSECQVHKF